MKGWRQDGREKEGRLGENSGREKKGEGGGKSKKSNVDGVWVSERARGRERKRERGKWGSWSLPLTVRPVQLTAPNEVSQLRRRSPCWQGSCTHTHTHLHTHSQPLIHTHTHTLTGKQTQISLQIHRQLSLRHPNLVTDYPCSQQTATLMIQMMHTDIQPLLHSSTRYWEVCGLQTLSYHLGQNTSRLELAMPIHVI